jgi:hypothetical protein
MPSTRHLALKSRRTRTRLALLSALVLVFLLPAGALAHVPALESASSPQGVAQPIGGPAASRAIYGYLAPGESYDEYEFTVSAPVTSTIGLLVPAYAEHRDFRPTLVVIADGKVAATIPDPGKTPRASIYEPFSLATFWPGGERAVGFVPGVQYRLRIEPGSGAPSGRYVIVFGGPESFEASEVAATLAELPVIWFGAYGGAPWHWNWAALVPLGIVAGILALIVMALVRRMRRHSP